MTSPVNRYKQLLALIPTGSFYASSGQVLPMRSQPYQLRLAADEPNQLYHVLLNDLHVTSVNSDSNSYALISISLQKGDNTIKLVNSVTATIVSAYLTTRDYATWMAALASIIESIDENIEQVLYDSRLATVSSTMVDEVFGKTVESSNAFSYDNDSYVELLQEMRTAFRHYAATDGGLDRIMRSWFNVSPLMFDRTISETWTLGSDLLYNHNRSDGAAFVLNTNALTNISASGATVEVVSAETRQRGNLSFQYSPSPKSIAYKPPNNAALDAQYGPAIEITGDGEYTLTGYVQQSIMSEASTFAIPPLQLLSIEIDDRGVLDVAITSGGAVTSATIAADINAAFNTSPLYGVAYASVASSAVPPLATGSSRLFIKSPTPGGKVVLRKAPAASGYETGCLSQIIFNIPAARAELGSAILAGATTINYTANSIEAAFPDVIPDGGIWCILDSRGYYATAGGSYVSLLPFAGSIERVKLVSINKTTNQMIITPCANAHDAGGTIHIDGDQTVESITYPTTATISVADYASLPVGSVTDTAALTSTGLPDGWLLEAWPPGTGTALPLTACYDTRSVNDGHYAFFMQPQRRLTVPIEGLASFAGFSATISVQAYSRNPGTTNPLWSFEVSHDNGATWSALTATTGTYTHEPLSLPKTYSVKVTVPSFATRSLIRFSTTTIYSDYTAIQRVSAVLDQTATGLFVGDGTVPNNEMRLKSGRLLLWWSCEQPTTAEKAAIGISSSTQESPGHLDKIAPDYVWLDKYDVTTYTGTTPNNLVGAFDATGLSGLTATNMSLTVRTPSRFSFLSPDLVSEQTETLTWATISPYTATISYASSQDLTKAVLMADGVPLLQTEWQFNSSTQVELLIAPVSTVTYQLTYDALISCETSVMDLGTDYADRAWYADGNLFVLPDASISHSTITSGIQFDANNTAILTEPSNGDKATATIYEDTGTELRVVPATVWSFVNDSTVRIDSATVNPLYVYSLTYIAATSHPVDSATVLLQHRSATTDVGVSLEAWRDIDINTPLGSTHRYHQLKATFTDVKDTRAVRARSLLVKGLNLHGAGSIPVLRP